MKPRALDLLSKRAKPIAGFLGSLTAASEKKKFIIVLFTKELSLLRGIYPDYCP
jgi:hypothetical protein